MCFLVEITGFKLSKLEQSVLPLCLSVAQLEEAAKPRLDHRNTDLLIFICSKLSLLPRLQLFLDDAQGAAGVCVGGEGVLCGFQLLPVKTRRGGVKHDTIVSGWLSVRNRSSRVKSSHVDNRKENSSKVETPSTPDNRVSRRTKTLTGQKHNVLDDFGVKITLDDDS